MTSPLWLSHHRGEGLSRCWSCCGLHVCARCSGLFPALLAVMVVEARWPAPLSRRAALALEVLLLVAGLWDVLRTQGALSIGKNWGRWLSGVGLGVVLGHAATVGHARGYADPEALFPLLTAALATLWVWDAERLRRREDSAASS